jgi:acetate kinase
MRILVINCGSATLKYKLFEAEWAGLKSLQAGAVEVTRGHRAAVTQALESLGQAPDAIAHRVVHGGDRLPDVVPVDVTLLNHLRQVESLAPLHNVPRSRASRQHLG